MKFGHDARINLRDYTHDSSYYRFENGDGTQYTIHLCKCENGGLYVICNDDSLWMAFKGDLNLKYLCGNKNEYTRTAIMQLLISREWV